MLNQLTQILLKTIMVLVMLRITLALVPRCIKKPIKWITKILWRGAIGTANMLKIAFIEFAPKKHKKVTYKKQPKNVIKVVFPNNKSKEYKVN